MSALSCKCPEAHELAGLDSFDLAFLVMTGHARMVMPVAFIANVMKKNKDAILWGPEAALVSRVLISAWRKHGKKLTDDVIAAFDLSGDVSVSRKETNAAFKRHKGVGKKVWNEARKKVVQSLAAAQERSKTHWNKQRKDVAKQIPTEAWEEWMQGAVADHVAAFTKSFPTRTLHPEVRRLVALTEKKPAARLIDKAQLTERIKNVAKMPEQALAMTADVQVGRMWTFTGLQMAHVQGVTEYQVISEEDRKVCPVCWRIHGRHFPVAGAHAKMEEVLAEKNPDRIVAAMPFPRVAVLDNKSPEQVRKLGLTPPFHGLCRCDVVFLWGEIAVRAPASRIGVLGQKGAEKAMRQVEGWEGDRKGYGTVILRGMKQYPDMPVMAAWRKDELLGLTALKETAKEVYVDSLASGGERGVGTQLMARIAKYASGKGKIVRLDATVNSKAFYEKIGMRKVGRLIFAWSPKDAGVFWRSYEAAVAK